MVAIVQQSGTSMQPGVKIAAAGLVLAVGLGLAMLFRRESPEFRPTAEPAQEQLVLHEQGEPVTVPALPWPSRTTNSAGETDQQSPAAEPPTVLAPRAPSNPPPTLAREYPAPTGEPAGWGTSRGMSMDMLVPRPTQTAAPRKHVIVDGDTLPELARRYLGSEDRYLEIYEANRDALPAGPDVLPIGIVLELPEHSRSGNCQDEAFLLLLRCVRRESGTFPLRSPSRVGVDSLVPIGLAATGRAGDDPGDDRSGLDAGHLQQGGPLGLGVKFA